MRVGVILGNSSGSGNAAQAFKVLRPSLRDCKVAVCAGPFAGDSAPDTWTVLRAHAGDAENVARAGGYTAAVRRAVEAFAEWRAELLVCVGGDGLSSYVADALVGKQWRIPILGIGAGTANVGPIVTTNLEDLPLFEPGALEYSQVGAVEVLDENGHVAYGFNDIVIGNSFLGTIDGNAANLSAEALLLDGKKRAIAASPRIAGAAFRVVKNGLPLRLKIARPSQIIVSTLGAAEFYGRAVAGVLCNAGYMEGAAAIALFDQIIVRPDAPEHGIDDFSVSEQMLFAPGDVVELHGMDADAYIVADGNPFARHGDSVSFKAVKSLVDIALIGVSGRCATRNSAARAPHGDTSTPGKGASR